LTITNRLGRILAFCALALCVACAPTPKVGIAAKGKSITPGLNARESSVDGLIVGHRLMQAGQHELALKAYYRAAGDQGLNADVLSALGSANLKLGRLGQAESLLRRALEIDEEFLPALNNLGVVLMEQGKLGEAERVFRTAFALDNGESAQIQQNLRLALAKLETPGYGAENNERFALMRRGSGEYSLLTTQ